MRAHLFFLTAVVAALTSVAAVPAKPDATDSPHQLQARAEIGQTLHRSEPQFNKNASKPLSCHQRCDADYVKTHQICLAAISGLSAPDAPQSRDCDRAAKAGIRQCQMKCGAPQALKPAEMHALPSDPD